MCWTLNHQNILEMPQGHISLSDLAFVGQTNSTEYTYADSSSELSRSTRCIVWATDFDVSLNRISQAKAQ